MAHRWIAGLSCAVLGSALAGAAPPGIRDLDEGGFSPLHRAALKGDVERARTLLAAGADVNVRQARYRGTPLQYAAHRGHVEVVRALLQHDALVDARDTHDRTPLMWAAMGGRAETVVALLDGGADVRAATASGWTALHYAAQARSGPVMHILVERGADVLARNAQQQSPPDLSPQFDLLIPWSRLARPSAGK